MPGIQQVLSVCWLGLEVPHGPWRRLGELPKLPIWSGGCGSTATPLVEFPLAKGVLTENGLEAVSPGSTNSTLVCEMLSMCYLI